MQNVILTSGPKSSIFFPTTLNTLHVSVHWSCRECDQWRLPHPQCSKHILPGVRNSSFNSSRTMQACFSSFESKPATLVIFLHATIRPSFLCRRFGTCIFYTHHLQASCGLHAGHRPFPFSPILWIQISDEGNLHLHWAGMGPLCHTSTQCPLHEPICNVQSYDSQSESKFTVHITVSVPLGKIN